MDDMKNGKIVKKECKLRGLIVVSLIFLLIYHAMRGMMDEVSSSARKL